jgi:hypothetical protein
LPEVAVSPQPAPQILNGKTRDAPTKNQPCTGLKTNRHAGHLILTTIQRLLPPKFSQLLNRTLNNRRFRYAATTEMTPMQLARLALIGARQSNVLKDANNYGLNWNKLETKSQILLLQNKENRSSKRKKKE